ncbi:MAG: ADP-ribosylglycohydrolase family protein [Methylobacter sp.]
METLDRFRGCLAGLAVGDAVGTALEFKAKGSFTPIIDMVGGGPFRLQPGEWTDDTSMALCLATSLLECQGFNAEDQMQRYCRWRDEGYLSSNGRCFDIGNTVNSALRRYQTEGHPYAGATDAWSAGNGSLMRLAPVSMFYFSEPEEAERYAAESSRTTHGAAECLDACTLFSRQLIRALTDQEKEQILFADGVSFDGVPKIQRIALGDYRTKSEDTVRGTGYVVDCLEAALWCFWTTDNFESAILKAANLGDDADTTAAVCGQLAGAYYGMSGIPKHWLERLVQREMIQGLADRLYQRQQNARPFIE